MTVSLVVARSPLFRINTTVLSKRSYKSTDFGNAQEYMWILPGPLPAAILCFDGVGERIFAKNT